MNRLDQTVEFAVFKLCLLYFQRISFHIICCIKHMSRHTTKPTNWHVRSVSTQISMGIRPVWSASSLSAWRKLGFLAIHWAHSEDYDQTGRMPRLIWVFAGRSYYLLVLSWGGSYQFLPTKISHQQNGSNLRHLMIMKVLSGRLTRSDAPPPGMRTVASSILRSENILSWRLIMK